MRYYDLPRFYVTRFYTFRQMFHDFALFLRENSIEVSNGHSMEVWSLEINGHTFCEEDFLDDNVADVVTSDTKCVFKVLRTRAPEEFARLERFARIMPGRVNKFNVGFFNAMTLTLDAIRENDSRVNRRLEELIESLYDHPEEPEEEEPLDFDISILPFMMLGFFNQQIPVIADQGVVVSLSESYFDSLPEIIPSAGGVCTICQDEFEEDEMVKSIKCGHEFHIDCVRTWLTRESTKCPNCRVELHTDDSQRAFHNV